MTDLDTYLDSQAQLVRDLDHLHPANVDRECDRCHQPYPCTTIAALRRHFRRTDTWPAEEPTRPFLLGQSVWHSDVKSPSGIYRGETSMDGISWVEVDGKKIQVATSLLRDRSGD